MSLASQQEATSSKRVLDPWSDAALIAKQLSQPNSQFIAILGAESWCSKCRDWRPVFDAAVQNAAPNQTWLWFDLEDHAEFIGSHIPEDLPMLLIYQQDRLVVHAPLPAVASTFPEAVEEARQKASKPDIGLRERLLKVDWAE